MRSDCGLSTGVEAWLDSLWCRRFELALTLVLGVKFLLFLGLELQLPLRLEHLFSLLGLELQRSRCFQLLLDDLGPLSGPLPCDRGGTEKFASGLSMNIELSSYGFKGLTLARPQAAPAVDDCEGRGRRRGRRCSGASVFSGCDPENVWPPIAGSVVTEPCTTVLSTASAFSRSSASTFSTSACASAASSRHTSASS